MVPKAGSSVMAAAFSQGCYTSRGNRTSKTVNVRFHNHLYTPCSIASLREPCERVVSAFAHLKASYLAYSALKHCDAPPGASTSNGTSDATVSSHGPRCRDHWLHRTHTVEAFVTALGAHWDSEILAYDPSAADLRLTRRHMVVALPQALWIGRTSLILCSRNLTAHMLLASRRLRCHGLTPALLERVQRDYDGAHRANASRAGSRDSATWPMESRVPGWDRLSEAGCRAVRRLYSTDARLWEAHCGP